MIKINFNKNRINNFLVCLGVSGIILGTLASSYTNFKNYDAPDDNISTEEFEEDIQYSDSDYQITGSHDFVAEFQKIYSSSMDLQREWADFYPQLCDILSNYGYLFNQQELLSSLRDLKFRRVTKYKNHDHILACYDFYDNTIYYTDALFNKKPTQIKELQFHEAIHFLFQNNFIYSRGNILHSGSSLDEGTASLFVREYGFYDRVDNYEKDVYYVRAMCELLGTENYLSCVCKHDYSKLIASLSKYSDKSTAKKLVKYMDEADKTPDQRGTVADTNAWNIINLMFENKYGVSIENSTNDLMKIYSNILAKTSYPVMGDEYSHNYTIGKRYFLNSASESLFTYKDGNGVEHNITIAAHDKFITSLEKTMS